MAPDLEAAYSEIARGHSADMSDGSVAFGHDGFDDRADEMTAHQPDLLSVGENVAWISAGWEAPAEEIVLGWLDSPPHRENIETSRTVAWNTCRTQTVGGTPRSCSASNPPADPALVKTTHRLSPVMPGT